MEPDEDGEYFEHFSRQSLAFPDVRYCTDLTKVRGVSRGEVVFQVKQLVFPTIITGAIYTFPNHLTLLIFATPFLLLADKVRQSLTMSDNV